MFYEILNCTLETCLTISALIFGVWSAQIVFRSFTVTKHAIILKIVVSDYRAVVIAVGMSVKRFGLNCGGQLRRKFVLIKSNQQVYLNIKYKL